MHVSGNEEEEEEEVARSLLFLEEGNTTKGFLI